MKNLIELNKEIEGVFNPEIYIFNEYRNITFCKHWVNDIYANQNYFHEWEERIINKINNIVDLDSPSKIKFIKVFHQDVLNKYSELSKIDYENLDFLKSFKQFPILFSTNLNRSKVECSEFYFHPDDFRYGDFLDLMARIFKIENFYYYDGDYSPDSSKYILEDLIMNKLHNLDEVDEIGKAKSKLKEEDVTEFNIDEIDETVLDKIDEILFDDKVEVEVEINRYYSYGFLSYCLENTRTLLKNIAKHLDDTVNFIKKLENYKEDEFILDEILTNDPTKVKFEFKISKKEIAILFKNLKDFGIFHINKKGHLSEQSQLIKYIDNANMYFPHNGKLKPVKGITKEFSKVYAPEERIMHQDLEKKFLKDLIKDLTKRIEEINSEEP